MKIFGTVHFQCSTWPSAKEKLHPWLWRLAGRSHHSSGIPESGQGMPKSESTISSSCTSKKTNNSDAPGRLISVSFTKEGNPASVGTDRKSTRLNSSHQIISYAVFCL